MINNWLRQKYCERFHVKHWRLNARFDQETKRFDSGARCLKCHRVWQARPNPSQRSDCSQDSQKQ
jgi:hypothetical protein